MAMENSPDATMETSEILFVELEKLASVIPPLMLSTKTSNSMLRTFILITNLRK